MITDKGQCRPLLDFKGFDWKTATLEDRIEFALADVGEAGMSHFELRAMDEALQSLAPNPITIVETGLGWGFSTRLFLAYILKYGGELHTIDIMAREGIVGPLKTLGLWDKVNMVLHDSRNLAWDPAKKIDFLNIDSEHAVSFVLSEYFRFRDVLRNERSVIGFHDTDSCWGVIRGLEILDEIDVLEPFTEATNLAGAGWKSFHLVGRDRNDKDWNSRGRK